LTLCLRSRAFGAAEAKSGAAVLAELGAAQLKDKDTSARFVLAPPRGVVPDQEVEHLLDRRGVQIDPGLPVDYAGDRDCHARLEWFESLVDRVCEMAPAASLELVWTDGDGFAIEDDRELLRQIVDLLSDGEWRTAGQIREEVKAAAETVRKIVEESTCSTPGARTPR